MTSALNNLFFLTKDPPVPTHHRAQIGLSNLVPFPLQKIFTPLPNIFWTLLSKMWPILYEKCPILTNHISYWSKDFLRGKKTVLYFMGTFHISQIGTSVGDFSILSYFPRTFHISFIWNLVSGIPSISWEFYLSLIFHGKFWYFFHWKFGRHLIFLKIAFLSDWT